MSDIQWDEFIDAYFPASFTWIILSALTALPEYSLGSAFLQAIFILSWSYWAHPLGHYLALIYPFNIMNPHVAIHHNKLIILPRWLELLCEAITNFLGFFLLSVIQDLLNIHILSKTMLIGYGFLYIAIHILDYSINGNEKHKKHHENEFCNYNPEVFDTLFNTRCDPKEPYTNNTNEIIHGVGAFGLAYVLKLAFGLD